MKPLMLVGVLVYCLALFGCGRSGDSVARSTLAVADATGRSIIFVVQLRKGDSVCVALGDNGTTLSYTPERDASGQLVVEHSGRGLKISGLLGYDNPGANNVKLLESVREENGRFRVATYTEWDVPNIPVYVHLQSIAPAAASSEDLASPGEVPQGLGGLRLTKSQSDKVKIWLSQHGPNPEPAKYAYFIRSILRDDQKPEFNKIMEAGGR